MNKAKQSRNSRKNFASHILTLLSAAAIAAASLLAANPQSVHADTLGGATETYEAVSANSTDEYKITFKGGEWAMIEVSGDGDTDLDLEVLGPNGRRVAIDDDELDYCVGLFWVPRTATYTVSRDQQRRCL